MAQPVEKPLTDDDFKDGGGQIVGMRERRHRSAARRDDGRQTAVVSAEHEPMLVAQIRRQGFV